MLIDSGATSNIIDEETWETLKSKRIACHSYKSDKKLYAYACKEPLSIKGAFTCEVKCGKRSTEAEFVVIKGKGESLLGKETATKLGALRIGLNIATISDMANQIQEQYPVLFRGVGKLNTKQIGLYTDETVTPIAQPIRRIPFHLREAVERKIQQLLELDIIEPVTTATPWVNPVVIVPKTDKDIRLCLDMRQANKAIIRGRYPIPTVDELLQNMNGSSVLSKLDLKWGYHQLELTPQSRGITTFAVHNGTYRYKRLVFGVSSVSEQYQHEVGSALAGIEGVENISDDIIIHAPTQEIHDQRLHAVLQRLANCGLTLNGEKCQYNMNKLVFMGMLLSEKGIGPTAERVQAVVNAREPETASEVRSFLGLVGYSSRFIPQFASVTEPLRRLTKKDTPFKFGPEQRLAFQMLKQKLAEAGTLAYFDKKALTKVIADASPVGIGAVLIQEQSGENVPICYVSRSLTECEQRKGQQTHEHEAEEYIKFVAVNATPSLLTTRTVEEASATDNELRRVRQAIQTGDFSECKSYTPIANELSVIGQLVLRGTRIVIPQTLRARTLNLAHEGHLGIVGTKQNLRSKVWWPAMDKDAERHVRSCHGCQLVMKPDKPEPLRMTQLPEMPWQDLATDLLGPLPTGQSIMVVVDYYSRYYEYGILKSTTADKVIDCLEEVFSRHGLPCTIRSDCGPQFMSTQFQQFCETNGIQHVKTTPRWAQANGEVKRQNASILKRIRIAQAEGLDWRKELRKYVAMYRAIDHNTTGKSPAELLFNRKIRGKLPDFTMPRNDQEIRDRDAEQKGKNKLYADHRRGAKYSQLEVGDQVLVRQEKTDKLTTTFNPVPFTVVSRKGNSVTIEDPGGTQYKRNTTFVKKFFNDNTKDTPVENKTGMETEQTEPVLDKNEKLMSDKKPNQRAPLDGDITPQTRPKRQIKLPEKLKDFIVE
ncbi:uncharacterized protein K02A2.6 [Labeo rohita]|uniref:uncharacterized protein K02A2.6 n=1 Tax=Labeo rohita TaxID=84645 RepID=UPI0021E1FBAE|nr:uncharacterized protein K02A2.6 [Labeo rohita]